MKKFFNKVQNKANELAIPHELLKRFEREEGSV